jgi:uncharacterized protein YbcI
MPIAEIAIAPKMLTTIADSKKHGSAGSGSDENLSRDVSRAMVKLFKDHIGRGPSHARAHIHEDLIVVVLRETMTKAERTLAGEGEEDLVRGVRHVLDGAFREDANAIIERLVGRAVSAFLSDHDVERDIVLQAFVLAPRERESSGVA